MKKSRTQLASLMALTVFILSLVAIAPAALASKGQVLFTDVNGTPKPWWRVGETLFITVIDPDENRDSDEVELLTGSLMTQLGEEVPVLEILDPASGDSWSSMDGLVLQETGTNTGIFRSQTGIIITKAFAGQPVTPGDAKLEVFDTDTIVVRYQDPTNPNDISVNLGKIYTGDVPGSRARAIITITDAAGTPVSLTDIGRTIFVTVTDADENLSPATIESVKVTLVNERILRKAQAGDLSEGQGVLRDLPLVETGPNTGVFRNVEGIVLVDEKNVGRTLGATEFRARDKDTIVAYYRVPAHIAVAPPPPLLPCQPTRTDVKESALARYGRVVPVRMKPGEECVVKVTATAKQALKALLVSEKPDPAFTVTGDTRGAGLNLAAGQKVELTYRIRAGAAPGTFKITGTATPATEAGPQPGIDLESSINVTAGSAASTLSFAKLRVDTASTDIATVSRDLPDRVAVGQTVEVKVTVTAKQALRAVLISDNVDGLQLVGGTVSKAGTITPLSPGQTFTHTYKVQCTAEGTFIISGRVIPVTAAGSQAPITLDSSVVCGVVPALAGMGDDNDPHDFALAQVKVAERNPSRISIVDITGRERTELRIGDDIFVRVEDRDQNADSDRVERIVVHVFDVNGGLEDPLVLVETGVSTGVFQNTGPLKLVPKAVASCPKRDDETVFGMGDKAIVTPTVDEPNDMKLAVSGDDVIYVLYDDARVERIEGRDEIKRSLDSYDIIAVTATVKESPFDQFDKKIRFVDDTGRPVSEYKVGMDAFVQLDEPDANLSSDLIDQVVVLVLDRHTGDVECLTLQETGPNTGLFMSQQGLPLRRPEPAQQLSEANLGDGILQMQDRDSIEAHHQDADNPSDYAATIIGIIPLMEVPVIEKPTIKFEPAGKLEIGKSVVVEVTDKGRKGAKTLKDAVTLTLLRAGTAVKSWTLTLTETATAGVFRSDALHTGEPGSGAMIEAQDGDMLKAEYLLHPEKPSTTLALEIAKFEVKQFTVSDNPMDVSTTFKAIGTGIERISVSVYDLTGRAVFSGSKAGAALDWKGTVDGELLGNGVYLFFITASGKGQTKTSPVMKLVILR